MKSEKELIAAAVESNCRLLNDALESELRKIHNGCPVRVSERCIELIVSTIQYTQLYMELKRKFMEETLHENNCLVVGEPSK